MSEEQQSSLCGWSRGSMWAVVGDEIREVTRGRIIWGLTVHCKDFGFSFK